MRRPGRSLSPAVALIVLSPLIGELHFGATRITLLPVFVLQIGLWGCATALIREVARRRPERWESTLLLGLALALAEECVIQQTSLAPLPGADPNRLYGRWAGVNWVYLLWALVYECVWIVLVPIQLAELIYRGRRHEAWLGKRGLRIAAAVAAVASLAAWYSWTQVFMPRFYPEFAAQVTPGPIAVAAVAIVALIAFATRGPAITGRPGAATRPPGAGVVGLVAFLLGLPWFGLILLAYGMRPDLPVAIPLGVGALVGLAALVLFSRWARHEAWDDRSRLAAVAGTAVASMLAGFVILLVGQAGAVDIYGKLALNLLVLAGLARLGSRLSRRAATPIGGA